MGCVCAGMIKTPSGFRGWGGGGGSMHAHVHVCLIVVFIHAGPDDECQKLSSSRFKKVQKTCSSTEKMVFIRLKTFVGRISS